MEVAARRPAIWASGFLSLALVLKLRIMREMDSRLDVPAISAWRIKLHEIIFEADTVAGKLFDVILLIMIVLSIFVVMLDSVTSINETYQNHLRTAEWVFTILFTVEYVLRLMCVRRPLGYALSFFGLVDLLAILPTFISLVLARSQPLLVIRGLRLLRVFRIFKLARYLSEAGALRQAIWASRAKITVFIMTVLMTVIIMGSAMYLIEGKEDSGFTSIPQSMYWAVVTMTTVGYGDIAPVTTLGKTLAAMIMILGYSMIIIPTGIISAEMVHAGRPVTTQSCPNCMAEDHAPDAAYCRLCGCDL